MIEKVESRQREVAESQKWFKTLFENSNDAILVFDPSSDQIINANPAACRMLEFSKSELLVC